MKITIKGARSSEECSRAYSAAYDLATQAMARGVATASTSVTDPDTGATWRFKLTRKGNVTATRIEKATP